ncbi:MAG: peptidase M4, partial [Cystobacter sp.]
MAKQVWGLFCAAWVGASLTGCGSVEGANEEALVAGEKDVDIQTALARFKDARVVGSESGVPYAVQGRLGQLDEPVGSSRADSGTAREAVSAIAPAFRLNPTDLVLQRVSVDERGHQHLRYQQTFNGLRVLGGE